jgi:hypothetical protein
LEILKALKNNILASESTLYIFADGPKVGDGNLNSEKIFKTRDIIKSDKWCKEVIISESRENKGLVSAIIMGVSEVVRKHGKIIVLEDDILASQYFLRYMNDALNFYQNEQKVWHISGYSYPINKKGLGETYFSSFMSCWGWGTWYDRWQYFRKNTDELLETFTEREKCKFNYGKNNWAFSQIEANKSGQIDTWAIYWYATIFKHNGLCLNPKDSFVQNIGMDGSGVHCGSTKEYNVRVAEKYPLVFETKIYESNITRKKIAKNRNKYRWGQIMAGIIKRLEEYGLGNTMWYYIVKYLGRKKNGI